MDKQQHKEIYRIIQCPSCKKYQRVLKLYIFNRDKFTCQHCQTPESQLDSENFLTVHHVFAKCNGTRHKVETIDNCVTWCYKCHREFNLQNPDQRIEVSVCARVS